MISPKLRAFIGKAHRIFSSHLRAARAIAIWSLIDEVSRQGWASGGAATIVGGGETGTAVPAGPPSAPCAARTCFSMFIHCWMMLLIRHLPRMEGFRLRVMPRWISGSSTS